MAWDATYETLDAERARRYVLAREGQAVTYGETMAAWRGDAPCRELFTRLLADVPFPAFYFETPPVDAATLDRPFEFVVIDSPLLAGFVPDAHTFAAYFDTHHVRDGITTFANLGGDAVLVAPCPAGPLHAYAHLASFVRRAPAEQQHALWQRVAAAMDGRLKRPDPVWLSTAGQGVAWLHVRLDDRPKYYNHGPYRRAAAAPANA